MFCKKHKPNTKHGAIREDLSTYTYWYHLSRIQDSLNLYHVAILVIKGNEAFFYDWFSQLSWSLDELDNWSVDTCGRGLRGSPHLQSYQMPHDTPD